ncbi:MAG: RsmD family RNA methyltransferase [Puniceicoccales bacterium]|jgi:16S rRNA (guanine966-N2)-methyltransferase|nr:RsmD family RNA methyltransferase [Puniceicoccales bacterium]
MRITGGAARSINLLALEHGLLRPATDFLRQAVFSSLGDTVAGKNFLDLFAGTGAYGLEALSRGATGGLFVERNFSLKSILQKNINAVSKSLAIDGSCCSIALEDCLTFNSQEKFGLIFIDPPYDIARNSSNRILANTLNLLWNTVDARIIFEVPSDLPSPVIPGLEEIKRIGKNYKKNSPSALIYAKTLPH